MTPTSQPSTRVLVAGYPALTENYCFALQQSGLASDVCLSCDIAISEYGGLLLPGGGDIEPSLFHQENMGSKGIDLDLDQKQLTLLSLFIDAKKPILGICKGLQLINVAFGGDVIQDLPTARTHSWNGEDMIHPTIAVSGSFLHKLYGSPIQTNSAHHQGVGALGKQLQIIQFSKDHVVEGLCHSTLPIIALQWHPERMCFRHKRSDTADGEKIFIYFKSLLSGRLL